MALSLKSQGQYSQTFAGLQVPDSAYGQAMPYAFGHCRTAHKLIYWSNFQSAQQGGKKGGKGGGQTVYTVNADMAIAYGPLEGIASIWQNQTWWYVTYESATFTGSGTSTTFTFTLTPVTATIIMVMGVQLQVAYSVAFSDYGGYGITRSSSASGTSYLPLYNNEFPAPNYGTFANANIPTATYNTSYGSTTVTVTFPTAVTNPTVVIYWCENGGNDQPQNPSGGKKGGGGIPIQVPGLTFERILGSGPSGNPQVFDEFSGVGGANIPLGPSPTIPYFNYEIKALFGMGNSSPVASYNPSTGGYTAATTSGDCCPADIIADIVTSGNRSDFGTGLLWNHGLGFSAFVPGSNTEYAYSRYGGILADEPSTYGGGGSLGLTTLRNYCMAYGIFISGCIDSQRSGADLLDELCKVSNCAAVWNGAALDFIPYCEVSAYGNGTEYVAPTASGPIFNITDHDLLPLDDKSPIQMTRDRPPANFNSLQIGFKDATQQFNDNYVILADSMDIMVQGAMPGPQETYAYITSPAVAQSVGWARLRRTLTIDRIEYKFSLPAYWEVILTPMDLITILDPGLGTYPPPFGPNPIPVRIKTIDISVDKEGKRKMDLTAEPFIYGGSVPNVPPTAGSPGSSSGGGSGSNPSGSVNAPIFIETVPGLNTAGPQLWICVSSSAPFYGGCDVWLSLDGGSTYGSAPIGRIVGRQTMGAVYNSNYPSHANPDNSNTLDVDLTESLGTLTGVASAVQNSLGSLWYLAGGGSYTAPNGAVLTIPYELGAFQGASLLATNKYGLTPPNLRGQLNTPVNAHNIGSAFSYLNDGIVFKMNLAASMIGTALYFKFTAFNNTQGNEQELSSVTAYSFTPTGLVGWTYTSSGGTGPTGSQGGANDMYGYVPGTYAAGPTSYTPGDEIWSAQPVRNVTLPAGLTNSLASCDVAPTSNTSLSIYKISGGSPSLIGTINFAASATTGTFTFASAVTLNGTGDYIAVVPNHTADSTFAGARWTFWANRSN